MTESSCTTGEDVFLAERIVDSGFGQQDGKRYYKVKWVRYSWEAEDSLAHIKELVDLFWSEHGGINNIKSDKFNDFPQKNESVSTTKELESEEGDLKVDLQDKSEDHPASPSKVAEVIDENSMSVSILIKENNEHDLGTGEISSSSMESLTQEDGSLIQPDNEKCMEIEKHTCDICFRIFNSIQSLKSHKRSHLSEKAFQCETCFKCFGERSTLKRHMYIHLEEKPFKCDHCERAFSDKSTLRRHTITHTGDKRFQCNICTKRFTRNEHLRQHMYIHTAEKLYKCEICDKDFRQRSTLKNHMLLHRAESGLKCGKCGAIFMRETLFDKHIVWCSGTGTTKQLRCEYCETFYLDEISLKTHQIVHTGDRPYTCVECNQTFTYRSILKRHILTHVELKALPCVICCKEFRGKADLITHYSTEHPAQPIYELLNTPDYTIPDTPINMEAQTNPPDYNIPDPPIDMESQTSTLTSSQQPNLSYIIQSPDALNEVEISSVSSAADISSSMTPVASDVAHTVGDVGSSISGDGNNIGTGVNISQHDVTTTPLQLHLNTSAGLQPVSNVSLQPGDNQLLQVQIIRMEDGNQFVQSIHAIMQDQQKESTVHFEQPPTQMVVNNDELAELRKEQENDTNHINNNIVVPEDTSLNVNQALDDHSKHIYTENIESSSNNNDIQSINISEIHPISNKSAFHELVSAGSSKQSNMQSADSTMFDIDAGQSLHLEDNIHKNDNINKTVSSLNEPTSSLNEPKCSLNEPTSCLNESASDLVVDESNTALQ